MMKWFPLRACGYPVALAHTDNKFVVRAGYVRLGEGDCWHSKAYGWNNPKSMRWRALKTCPYGHSPSAGPWVHTCCQRRSLREWRERRTRVSWWTGLRIAAFTRIRWQKNYKPGQNVSDGQAIVRETLHTKYVQKKIINKNNNKIK